MKLGIAYTLTYKIFKDIEYRDWIISITYSEYRDRYLWYASPRWWIGSGFLEPLIGMKDSSILFKEYNEYESLSDLENYAKELIDKFEFQLKIGGDPYSILNELKENYELKHSEKSMPNVKIGIEDSIEKYKCILNIKPEEIGPTKMINEIVSKEIEDLMKTIANAIENGKLEVVYSFDRLDKILNIDEYFEAQNTIIEKLEELGYKLKIDKNNNLVINWDKQKNDIR
jgi:antitoxin component HigA of HigAB toxin-antitoxin module